MIKWESLVSYADWGEYQFLTENLSDPDCIRWPFNSSKLENAFSKVEAKLRGSNDLTGLLGLLHISLLANLLIRGEGRATCASVSLPPDFLENIKKFVPELVSDSSFPGIPAITAPVVVTQGEGARIIFFIICRLSSNPGKKFPDWIRACLDTEAVNGIEETIAWVNKKYSMSQETIYVFPLLLPECASSVVHGRSLCLPIALHAISLLNGSTISPDLVATGDLKEENGEIKVGRIAGISRKAAVVQNKGYSLFIYPSDNVPGPACPEIKCTPVSTLDQATMWATLYAPGRYDDLNLLQVALSGADGLVHNFRSVPTDFLKWSVEKKKVDGLLDQVICDRDRVGTFMDQLKGCLYNNEDLEKLETLGNLAEPGGKRLEKMRSTSPNNAFRWCSYNFKGATHRGNWGRSIGWKQGAEAILKTANEGDLMRPEVVSFVNSCVIDEMHNLFFFSPILPDRFCAELEKQNNIQDITMQPDPLLGKLYGTIAQNYGFCGPNYLTKMEEAAGKAMYNFGNGKNPDAERDWRRQFSYLAYARMDAGLWIKAREALFENLDLVNWNGLEDFFASDIQKKSFPVTLLVRYLADTWSQNDTKNAWDACKSNIINLISSQLPKGHPWQLFAYSTGRLLFLAGEKNEAERAWRESLRLCDRIKGDTPYLMKLLALSALKETGMWNNGDMDAASQIAEFINGAKYLNRKHFKEFTRKARTDIDSGIDIDIIAQNPGRFFPFTYR